MPEDGVYTVSVHDMEYAAAVPGFFRLKIGSWASVDQVYPPVLSRNQPATVELLGTMPPVHVPVAPPVNGDILPIAWPKDGLWSGPRPFVRCSSHPELVQASQDKMQELPSGPVGISGRLLTPFAEDRFRLNVVPGQKLRLEVFAERLGSPLDTALVLRNEKGAVLVRAEDSPGTLDPVLDYTVPDKTTVLLAGVVDAQGRGGPRGLSLDS